MEGNKSLKDMLESVSQSCYHFHRFLPHSTTDQRKRSYIAIIRDYGQEKLLFSLVLLINMIVN